MVQLSSIYASAQADGQVMADQLRWDPCVGRPGDSGSPVFTFVWEFWGCYCAYTMGTGVFWGLHFASKLVNVTNGLWGSLVTGWY